MQICVNFPSSIFIDIDEREINTKQPFRAKNKVECKHKANDYEHLRRIEVVDHVRRLRRQWQSETNHYSGSCPEASFNIGNKFQRR